VLYDEVKVVCVGAELDFSWDRDDIGKGVVGYEE